MLRFRWGAVRAWTEEQKKKHPKWPAGTEGGKGGKFKPAGMSEWTTKMVDWLRQNGGFSVHPKTGSEPDAGYMVAVDGHSGIYPADRFYEDADWRESVIDDWLKREADQFDLDPEHMYIGGYADVNAEGEQIVVLDPSENVFVPEAEAVRLGTERNQVSIYDVVNHEVIDTGGTGGYRSRRRAR